MSREARVDMKIETILQKGKGMNGYEIRSGGSRRTMKFAPCTWSMRRMRSMTERVNENEGQTFSFSLPE